MTRVFLKGTRYWSENESFTDIQKAYESGLAGCYTDPEDRAKFLEEQKAITGYSAIGPASSANSWAGSGAGKLVIPFVYVLEAYPGCWPGPAQQRGDCFVAGTMVRMADGSEKPIEDVLEGDSVLSPFGGTRKVLSTFSKPFHGELVELQAKGHARRILATPDHKFVNYVNRLEWVWTASENMAGGFVSIPNIAAESQSLKYDLAQSQNVLTEGVFDGSSIRRKPPALGKVRALSSRSDCNRHVEIDEDLAWLIGIFLAEGSTDKSPDGSVKRVTFNLNRKEQEYVDEIARIVDEKFGLKAVLSYLPSKPNVVCVRVGSVVFGEFIRKVCGDCTTYTKKVPGLFFGVSKNIKLAFLRGWFDGDGCLCLKNRSKTGFICKLTGVSVSEQLASGMFYLLESAGVSASLTRRKPRKRSKEAYDVHVYGSEVLKLYPEVEQQYRALRTRPEQSKKASYSEASKLLPAETCRISFSGTVYCIEVEEDHAFIANGYAVHNCVSHSTKNAALGSMVLEVIAGKPDEVTGKRERLPEVSSEGIKNGVLSTEAIYWYRRHGGDGWMCPDSCRVLQRESGCWLRQDYPELGIDLTRYSGQIAGKWGSRPPTGAVAEQGLKNLCRAFAEAPSTAERRDALANGYFMSTCGGESYARTRDKNGVSKRTPEGWAHAMACIGYDDRPSTVQEYGCPLELILNSWNVWNSGPRDIKDSAAMVPAAKKQEWITKGIVNAQTGNIMIPEGAFWALSTETRNRDCWAVSSVNGWPRKNLPDWGGSLFG